jgi:ribosomal protein L37AE/L43A
MDLSSIDFRYNRTQCSNCGSDIHKRTTCPLLPCNSCGENWHTTTTCPTKNEGRKLSDRIRHRRENSTSEQIQQHNYRNRVENMNDDQIENQRSRHRVERMSDAQIERQRNYRNNLNSRFVSMKQEWDDEHPCPYCHCTFLKSVKKKARRRCCNNGEYLQLECAFPKLEILPETLKWLCLQRGEHFGKSSAKYNNILSIGSTGVENNKGGGYEAIMGDSAVKMNGRSYHFLSNTGRRFSGINYFTFDGLEDAQIHLDQLNSNMSEGKVQKKKLETDQYFNKIADKYNKES